MADSPEDLEDQAERERLSYLSPDLVDALMRQSKEHRRERDAENARLEVVRQKSTFQSDSHPHDTWSTRCLGCGAWLVTCSEGMWGPEWTCPTSGCRGWDYRYDSGMKSVLDIRFLKTLSRDEIRTSIWRCLEDARIEDVLHVSEPDQDGDVYSEAIFRNYNDVLRNSTFVTLSLTGDQDTFAFAKKLVLDLQTCAIMSPPKQTDPYVDWMVLEGSSDGVHLYLTGSTLDGEDCDLDRANWRPYEDTVSPT